MKSDREIKDWFERMKQEDARLAPPFASSWQEAVSRVRMPVRWSYGFALAMVALVLAAAALVLMHRSRPSNASIAQLSAWHSPTGFLLETPGRELLRTTPRFGAPFAVGKQSEEQK